MALAMSSVLGPYFDHPSLERDLATLRKRDGEIPRFLFRGFNKRSGGNSNLNTRTAITPHAFYGIRGPKQSRNDGWIAAMMATVYGSERKLYPPTPVTMRDMPFGRLRAEINGHLGGDRWAHSHFSSWTADLQIAMDFARCGPSPYIGVSDTQQRHDDNVIMPVHALWEVGFSDWDYHYEYLVYGPVQGESYCCMTLAWQMHPLDLYFNLWAELSPHTTLAHIFKARDRAGRHSFYRAVDTWLGVHLGSCPGPALYLTVIAAEWGRSKTNSNARSGIGRYFNAPKVAETTEAVSNLSWLIERAARNPNLVLPLVNSATYKTELPRVHHMIHMLCCIQTEIGLLRSRPRPQPVSLIGYFWPQTPDQKRKATELEVTGDTQTRSKTVKN